MALDDSIRAIESGIRRVELTTYYMTMSRLLRKRMTPDTFARLRSTTYWLRLISDGSRPLFEPGEVVGCCKGLPQPVTAAAGDWFHSTWRDGSTSDKPYRWHSFTGDLLWKAAADRVAVEAVCGQWIGADDHAVFAAEPPAGAACRRCLARISAA